MLLVVSVLGGCRLPVSPAAIESDDSAVSGTHLFTDSCGRVVELPSKITRAAPSGNMAQMILYSLAPECVMGWSRMPDESVLKFFPDRFRTLPEFGQFYGTNFSLNLEALIAAKPQVIIDIGDQKPTHKADMDGIQEQTGIPTIFIEADLATFPAAYRTLGELFNKGEQAEDIAAYIESTTAQASAYAAKIAEADRLTVMFGTGVSGLDVNARGSIHADVIEIAGAVNAIVVPEVSFKGGGNTISMEELLNADPDVIILSPGGPFASIGDDPLWQGLSAVKSNRYYEIPKGPFNWMSDPPSVNRIIGIKWLGNLLYPAIFKYDMITEAKAFYKLFWHYNLTEEEAAALIANSTTKATGGLPD